jgi:uncharacterized protein
MSFRGGARLDPSQVEDARGGGYGGPVLIGGGGIGLLLLIASLILGVNPLSDYSGPQSTVDNGPSVQDCQTGADANRRTDCRVVGFVDSIQKFWTDEFSRRGKTYHPARTVLFTYATASGCGTATESMGPFYCPDDGKVYLDISFFDDLVTKLGAQGGPLAQGYVVAHEYGHHVQDELGLLERQSSRTGAKSQSVRIELQADCLAGVWARHAADTGYLEAPTNAEIAQALDAAGSVGDDRIQQETQGRVVPEQWTHGSSAQRQHWFATGYQNGDLNSCDTSGSL